MKLIDDIGLSHLIEKLKALIGLKADKTYVDNKVKTDVPTGAKFTDTVYTHPASHPASMITGLPTSLPASGGNADTVGGFTVGVNVPANAEFTDTTTTINGKTGAIAKADITALGIPAQDTVYTHPSNHPASMITESSTRRFVSDSEKSTWNGKQNALGYIPVNKAGDNITGQLGLESTIFPVIDIARNTSGSGSGLYGGARLQRKTTNPTNGVGIGFYFQAPNSNKEMIHAGMFGGALGTINAGSEKGEIVLSPSYAGQDPYTRRDFIVRAISASKAEAELNGKLRTEQTLASDPINTVATKKYVDDKTKTITSATEPNLNTGDQWHKEI